MSIDRHEHYVAQVVAGLYDIALTFAGDIKRMPSSSEMFEVLTWAVKSLPDDTIEDVNPAQVIALKPQVKKSAKSFDSWASVKNDESAVRDLNDSTFVTASDFLNDLSHAIQADSGSSPTLDQLCNLLAEGLRQSGQDLLVDIPPSSIRSVKAEVPKQRKVSVKVGDIVAIPAKNGEYFITVVLAKNAFGIAFGFFKERSMLKPISIEAHPPVQKYPIYSDDRMIAGGRWMIIGHDNKLPTLFPDEPEIYHYPRDDEAYAHIGPYGAGETASGRLRNLSREEAAEIGLLSKEYITGYLSEHLEDYLNSTQDS